jgi:hypothetical protein
LNISPSPPSLLLRLHNNNFLKPTDVNRHFPKLELHSLLMVIPLLDPLYMVVFLISLNSLPPPYTRLKKVSPRRKGLLFKRNSSEPIRLHHPISQRMMSLSLLPLYSPSSPGILHPLHPLSYLNYLPCRLSRCLPGILLPNPRLRRRGLGLIRR